MNHHLTIPCCWTFRFSDFHSYKTCFSKNYCSQIFVHFLIYIGKKYWVLIAELEEMHILNVFDSC